METLSAGLRPRGARESSRRNSGCHRFDGPALPGMVSLGLADEDAEIRGAREPSADKLSRAHA